MPTPLDRAMQSKSAFFGFVGIISAAAVWTIWGGDIFPPEPDPKGDPEQWTESELRRWLTVRGLIPSDTENRLALVARVRANLRAPRN